MNHELPRELMESCLAAAQEATMQGFSESVLASSITPFVQRMMDTCYRMGFESGWRIREQQIARGLLAVVEPWAVKVYCSRGERTLRAGMLWRDGLTGSTWEVVEPEGGRIYSPSGLGGTATFWCKPVSQPDPTIERWLSEAREDGCVAFCGDSIAAGLIDTTPGVATVGEAGPPIGSSGSDWERVGRFVFVDGAWQQAAEASRQGESLYRKRNAGVEGKCHQVNPAHPPMDSEPTK